MRAARVAQFSTTPALPQAPVPATLNIAGYRFVRLDDPQAVRGRLLPAAQSRDLRGTVLLAEEGINFSLAGAADAVESFLVELRSDARFAGLEVKRSWSAAPPFRRLLVKCKREIIRMNRPAIQPERGRAPAVDARTLRRWLGQGRDDAGRPLVLLDTRNAFEVEAGTFEGALDWRLERFSDFPQALERHAHELAGKAVVSFCTGGIRCEKAALHLRESGHDAVWQLEGGILKYFEETDGAHFRGHCFVFDERTALQADLQPAGGPTSGEQVGP
jgi:UPF0176 protein